MSSSFSSLSIFICKDAPSLKDAREVLDRRRFAAPDFVALDNGVVRMVAQQQEVLNTGRVCKVGDFSTNISLYFGNYAKYTVQLRN